MANIKFTIVFPGLSPTQFDDIVVKATLYRHRRRERQRVAEADEIDDQTAVVDGVDATKYTVTLKGPTQAEARADAAKNRRYTVRFVLKGKVGDKVKTLRRISRMWPNL